MRKMIQNKWVRGNIHVVLIVNKFTFLQFKIINDPNLDIDKFGLYNIFCKFSNGHLTAQTSKGKI